jgi:hypothetical protein
MDGKELPYILPDATNMFQDLLAGHTYWCSVEENNEERRKIMARESERAEKEAAAIRNATKNEGKTRAEGCSCLYGNPCVDKYVCFDWRNRFAIAKKNGWKEF